MKKILTRLVLLQVIMGITTASNAAEISAPFHYEESLENSIPFKINILKGERFQINRELSKLQVVLSKQTRELDLIRRIAEGEGIKMRDYAIVPESIPGAALYFSAILFSPAIRQRYPAPALAELTVGELVVAITALGGASWALYELADRHRIIDNLKSLTPEEIEELHTQKAEEYNRNLKNYSDLDSARKLLTEQINSLQALVD